MVQPKRRTLLSDQDVYLFAEGSHLELYDRLGAHWLPAGPDGEAGTYFAVWAPNAARVSVVGEWNRWSRDADMLTPVAASGIWEGFVPGVGKGAVYKYHVASQQGGFRSDKADPLAFRAEVPPRTASMVWTLDYEWHDATWMAERSARNGLAAPMSIYELHLGSWRRRPDGSHLSYRELAEELAEYVATMGFTHVELMPVMEHPYYASWGYQTTGYYAPTSRYGTPQDFMALVDTLHRADIGVILDWVPSHFPTDGHGPGYFDGTHLYEHADPRQGFHPDWKSFIWNYGRPEVQSFLLSSALFWLDRYHADAIRVDAVASMLYLDYSRQNGEWVANEHGGRENLEAIAFMRRLNQEVYARHPGAQTIAEESTAWPMVSRPLYVGGLGFGMKWDMGWMHDTLKYMQQDPIHRKFQHNALTFRGIYAFYENFVLPLSHDEVVHGKGSLLGKMAGSGTQPFDNLRLLFAWMYAQPGKKLLFMGGELGQWREWNHDAALDWHLLESPLHEGVRRFVADLNRMYRETKAMHEVEFEPAGFTWIDCADAGQSIVSLERRGRDERDRVVAVFNFTPVTRRGYRIGVPYAGFWRERLNSDAAEYGGDGQGNFGGVEAEDEPKHGHPRSIALTLPGLSAIFLVCDRKPDPAARDGAEAVLAAGAESPMPAAAELLARYVEEHNRGVASKDWTELVAVFDADAVMELRLLGREPQLLSGREPIALAFEETPPRAPIELGPMLLEGPRCSAPYRVAGGERDEGTLEIEEQEGKIVALGIRQDGTDK